MTETETETDEVTEDTFVMDAHGSESTENVGEMSVEINVEDLVAELEADGSEASAEDDKVSRRKLEEVLEERRVSRDLMDMDEFDLED